MHEFRKLTFRKTKREEDKWLLKFILCYAARKEGEFSIGWNVDNQLNDFQLKRQDKANNMASKVTQAPLQQNKQQFEYNSALTLE